MTRTGIALAIIPAAAIILAAANVSRAEESWRLEEVELPRGMSPEISAVAFSPCGRLFVANRHGDVWTCEVESGRWRRFAHGLHEPLGLVVVFAPESTEPRPPGAGPPRESSLEVYVSHKPELTRLRDTTGDGVADVYETVAAAWPHTDNWHEHAFGLRRDPEGNLIMALGLADTAGPINTLWPRVPLDFSRTAAESKLSLGPLQGWLFKVTPRGEVVPWACGFREPCGIGLSPDGEIFITDQQGDYIPSSALVHVQRGRFYGHPASAKWAHEKGAGVENSELQRDGVDAQREPHRRNSEVSTPDPGAHHPGAPNPAPRTLTHDELAQRRTPEAVILPHGSMGGSPGEPVWDTTEGSFGPFAGQVFVGDFTRLISRIFLEEVDGQWQGACFSFLRDAVGEEAIAAYSGASNVTIPAGREGQRYFRDVPPRPGTPLRQGSMRMAFSPDGSLYVGQTTRGWAGGGDGLQRLVWTGKTPVEIHSMRLTSRGFRLRFTTPVRRGLAADASRYRMTRFRYVYHQHYGAPRVDEADVEVQEAVVDPSGDEVELVLAELEPGFIHELEIEDLLSRDGRPLGYPHAYYTLNRTLDGRRFEGSITDGPARPAAAEKPRDPDPRLGQRVYRTFCIQCHRDDGRGGGLPGVTAADFTRPDGVLTKTDQELAAGIAGSIEKRTMPPFGYVLSEQQILDVLAYLRAEFAPDR